MSMAVPDGYRALGEGTVAAYLAGLPAIRTCLGGDPESWTVREVGDGNLNLVFIVAGRHGEVCAKQALAYVRLVGESWPLKRMGRRFTDELGFAGAAMIRRALGLAHNIAMEWIRDPDLRASCERRNLMLARDLIVNAASYHDIGAVMRRACLIESGGRDA
jgi:5-methylthioribose kinase